jgi:signal transduction histidine kinase
LPGGARHVHAKVDLGHPGRLFVRGALVLTADAAFLALLWLVGRFLVGMAAPLPRWRRLGRSYRARLAVALTAFFIVPAIGFAAWTFARTAEDAGNRRDLLLAQTLRAATPLAATLPSQSDADVRLAEVTRGSGAEFGLYQGGRLIGVSHPVLADLDILPPLLPAEAFSGVVLGDALEMMMNAPGTEGRTLRMGYRVIRAGSASDAAVLAAPRLSDDAGLAREQEDLALVVLLAALVGAAAAVVAAQVAARALARPVSDLRAAALAVGRGDALPARSGDHPAEFEPVFIGFSRMAADVAAGRDALEEARRRTAAVLATVATGVIAVDTEGRILLANERARKWLATPLTEGSLFVEHLSAPWAGVGTAVERALRGASVAPLAIEMADRRYGAEVAGLGSEPGGVVLALTDLTDAAHTARVLAWGEMARQIAHEIKNPLTPLRLGLQHLRRVRGERPAEFDQTFDETSARILAEIDRLDTVARAFSRFALPADAAAPVEQWDLVAAAGEALALYRLGDGAATVRLEGTGPVMVPTRLDELKEVLVNLVENARNAGAQLVTLRVTGRALNVVDDGRGIAAADLARIFEPRFSTTTSGAGLGLSIVKRLVESWGASIAATSAPGQGTTVTITFA